MTEVCLEDYTSGWKFQLLAKSKGGWLPEMWLMSIARTPCLYQYKPVTEVVQHVTPTAATAREIFEINACQRNTFENSCQTTCQLQYILVGLSHYSTRDVHWKKNNLAMCLWLVVCTCWQQRTFRAYWLLCGMSTLFFFLHFPDGSHQAFKHFFLFASCHLAVTLLTHCPTWQLFIQQRNRRHCL